MSDPRPVCALAIGGSDSGGGAGVQADLRTFAAHGIHGLSAITALTAQHTRAVIAMHVPPVAFLRAQIDACFDDFRIGAVKIGMLANADVVETVAAALRHYRPPFVVLDPVMLATSGAPLLDDEARGVMVEQLIPLVSVLTPNRPEAEFLLETTIASSAQADAAMDRLLLLGADAVLLKGGHLDEGNAAVDRFVDARMRRSFERPRLALSAHGTGCTLASAIAAHACRGETVMEACRLAGDHVHAALQHGYRPGTGNVLVLGNAVHSGNSGQRRR